MAYALVGTIGAVSVGASGAAVTPSWGASESRTANNLLILQVAGDGSTTLPAAPTGWSIGNQVAGGSNTSSIFFKIAAGADAAPTVAGISSDVLSCRLAEFSGNATSSPLDQTGSATGTTTPQTPTCGAADAASGELIIVTGNARYTLAATKTLSNTLNNGATSNNVNNNSTSTISHYDMCWGITTGNSSADDSSFAFTTSHISAVAVVIASFKLGAQTKLQSVSVTSTTSPALNNQVGKLVAVTSTTVPSLLRQIGKIVSVSTTTSPLLTAGKVIVQTLGVTMTATVALLKQAQKSLSVTTTTSPALTRLVGKIVSVTSTTSPVLTAIKTKFVTLAVTTTTVPAMIRQVGKVLLVTTTTTPAMVRQIGKFVTVTTTTTATLVAGVLHSVTLAITTTTSAVLTAALEAAATVVGSAIPQHIVRRMQRRRGIRQQKQVLQTLLEAGVISAEEFITLSEPRN